MSLPYQLVGLMSTPSYMPLKQTKIYCLNRLSQGECHLHAGESGLNMNSPEHCVREVGVGKKRKRIFRLFSVCFSASFYRKDSPKSHYAGFFVAVRPEKSYGTAIFSLLPNDYLLRLALRV